MAENDVFDNMPEERLAKTGFQLAFVNRAVAATKAAAAAAEGAGRKVREVELMANAMKEQLRALTEAVSRIESVVTSSKSKAAEEQSEGSKANVNRREARKELGRRERRIRAAVRIRSDLYAETFV